MRVCIPNGPDDLASRINRTQSAHQPVDEHAGAAALIDVGLNQQSGSGQGMRL